MGRQEAGPIRKRLDGPTALSLHVLQPTTPKVGAVGDPTFLPAGGNHLGRSPLCFAIYIGSGPPKQYQSTRQIRRNGR